MNYTSPSMSNPPLSNIPNPNTKTNTRTALLSLPPDLLTEIIFDYLTPRDAISLSITCRHFFHGVLSQYNTQFWHQIGRFSMGRLPGFSKKWLEVGYIMLEVLEERGNDTNVREVGAGLGKRVLPPPEAENEGNTNSDNPFDDLLQDLNDYITEREIETATEFNSRHGNDTNTPHLTTKELRHLSKHHLIWHVPIASPSNGNPDSGGHEHENNARRSGQSNGIKGTNTKGYVVNYRLMLVDTMVGAAQTGCQWCLRWPHFCDSRASQNELEIALCRKCFEENIIPLRAVKPSKPNHKLTLTLTLIHTWRWWPLDEIISPGLTFRGDNCWLKSDSRVCTPSTRVRFDGVWRPQLQRRIWQQYGLHVSVDTHLKNGYKDLQMELLWRNGYVIKEKHEDWGYRYLVSLDEAHKPLPKTPKYTFQYENSVKTRRLLGTGRLTMGKRLHFYYDY